MSANKEFPLDKWLRKNPFKVWLVMFAIIATMIPIAMFYPAYSLTAFIVFIFVVLAFGLIGMIGTIVWSIKHPYKPEFCKECGRAKPMKYEE